MRAHLSFNMLHFFLPLSVLNSSDMYMTPSCFLRCPFSCSPTFTHLYSVVALDRLDAFTVLSLHQFRALHRLSYWTAIMLCRASVRRVSVRPSFSQSHNLRPVHKYWYSNSTVKLSIRLSTGISYVHRPEGRNCRGVAEDPNNYSQVCHVTPDRAISDPAV